MAGCPWQQAPHDSRMPRSRDAGQIRGRVLHVVNGEHYAGAERVQDLLGGALPWFGYEAGIACVKPSQFAEARKNRQVPLFDCHMASRFDVRPARKLARLIEERQYDLLHAHTPRSLLIAAVASLLARVPLVYHIHSPAVADTTNWIRNRANALLERVSLGTANHLIAVSSSLRERYLGLGFSTDRITVVSNGVPCGTSLPARERSPEEPVVFGMTALFRPRKGLEILLQSMASLLAQGKRLRLRAIGLFESPEYEKQIKQLAANLGVDKAIDWTGFSSNVEQELAQIDCLVLPSLFGEGLPMVILEAMAAGRLVIATDVEGTPEAIRHGENGLLARPSDPESLADRMSQVVDGSADLLRLTERATRDQRERFSVCSMARGAADVYDHVLGLTSKIGPCDLPCAVEASGSHDESGLVVLPSPIDDFTTSPESTTSP